MIPAMDQQFPESLELQFLKLVKTGELGLFERVIFGQCAGLPRKIYRTKRKMPIEPFHGFAPSLKPDILHDAGGDRIPGELTRILATLVRVIPRQRHLHRPNEGWTILGDLDKVTVLGHHLVDRH